MWRGSPSRPPPFGDLHHTLDESVLSSHVGRDVLRVGRGQIPFQVRILPSHVWVGPQVVTKRQVSDNGGVAYLEYVNVVCSLATAVVINYGY